MRAEAQLPTPRMATRTLPTATHLPKLFRAGVIPGPYPEEPPSHPPRRERPCQVELEPPGPRPGRPKTGLFLLGESPNEVDQAPPIVVGEVLPRRHGTPAVGDLPVELPVRLLLDVRRGPVGRLHRKRRTRGPVAKALEAVTRDTVGLEQLPGIGHDLVRLGHRTLHFLRVGGGVPLSLSPSPGRGQSKGDHGSTHDDP